MLLGLLLVRQGPARLLAFAARRFSNRHERRFVGFTAFCNVPDTSELLHHCWLAYLEFDDLYSLYWFICFNILVHHCILVYLFYILVPLDESSDDETPEAGSSAEKKDGFVEGESLTGWLIYSPKMYSKFLSKYYRYMPWIT